MCCTVTVAVHQSVCSRCAGRWESGEEVMSGEGDGRWLAESTLASCFLIFTSSQR